MTDFRGAAKALHIATYSGWYRFEQRDGQWAQTEKALTFWKMTALQVDPNDPRHIYVATEHSGLFVTADGGAAWRCDRARPAGFGRHLPHRCRRLRLHLRGRTAGRLNAARLSGSSPGCPSGSCRCSCIWD